MNPKAKILTLVTLSFTTAISAFAQLNANDGRLYTSDNRYLGPEPPAYFASIQGGGAMAFGDDSYHVFNDFKNACGWELGLTLGTKFSDLMSGRLKVRDMRMYSRVNLECLEANKEEHPTWFPRDGFYGYNVYNFNAEAMLDITHFFNKNTDRRFKTFIIGGVGLDLVNSYDPIVEKWKDLPNGRYYVDTNQHTMFCCTGGIQFDYRFSESIGIFAEATCTFTGDKLDGVVYEEPYDAYITASAGLTLYF